MRGVCVSAVCEQEVEVGRKGADGQLRVKRQQLGSASVTAMNICTMITVGECDVMEAKGARERCTDLVEARVHMEQQIRLYR